MIRVFMLRGEYKQIIGEVVEETFYERLSGPSQRITILRNAMSVSWNSYSVNFRPLNFMFSGDDDFTLYMDDVSVYTESEADIDPVWLEKYNGTVKYIQSNYTRNS